MTEHHVRRVSQIARDPRFCDQVTEDQDLFLKWAGEKWPVFLSRVRNWESLWDPIDPAALGSAHVQTGLGVGHRLLP